MSKTLTVDKKDIEARANGWIKKVENLYQWVKTTLQNEQEVEYKTDNNVVMYEELMEQFGVPAKNVPIFDLYVNKQLVASFKPIGLWVIGAKGRIDILTQKGAYILVDISDNESSALWTVFAPKNRKKAELFNETFINKLVHSK
jgi:hypothetical protein